MKKILLLLVAGLAISCSEKAGTLSETHKDFESNRWKATDVQTFEFEVPEIINSAKLKVKFSHVHEPQYANVPLEINIYSPDGQIEMFYANLRLQDAAGKSLSDCAGDVCDLSASVKENLNLEKGKYKVTVSNKFPNAFLPNVLALGVSIEK
jgi:gliding motility-associated lipoprotein GldH